MSGQDKPTHTTPPTGYFGSVIQRNTSGCTMVHSMTTKKVNKKVNERVNERVNEMVKGVRP